MPDLSIQPEAPEPSRAEPARPSRWKVFLLLLPTILSSVLMAAHFLRFALFPLMLFSLWLPLLLLFRSTWAIRIIQVALVIGAVTWIGTMNQILGSRMLQGQPFGRMAVILGGVTLFTLISAALLETPTIRGWRKGTASDAR